MSESETGLMTSREVYSGSRQPQPIVHSTNALPEGAMYKPLAVVSTPHGFESLGTEATKASSVSQHGMNMLGNGEATMKRKRGRPRKYGPDGSLSLDSATPIVAGHSILPPGGFVTPCSTKKARGRPPGSGRKWHVDSLARSEGNMHTFSKQPAASGGTGTISYKAQMVGGVAGALVAAAPVQVNVGRFIVKLCTKKQRYHTQENPCPPLQISGQQLVLRVPIECITWSNE